MQDSSIIARARRELAKEDSRLHISRKHAGEPYLYGAAWYITDAANTVTHYGSSIRDLGQWGESDDAMVTSFE